MVQLMERGNDLEDPLFRFLEPLGKPHAANQRCVTGTRDKLQPCTVEDDAWLGNREDNQSVPKPHSVNAKTSYAPEWPRS